MQTGLERRASVGDLLSGTFTELGGIGREMAIYAAVLCTLGLASGLGVGFGWVVQLAGTAAYFLGQYLLYQAMLQRAGLMVDGERRVFQFAGMALVLIVPITIGLNFFVLPGIVLAAKWVMAPAFLVARPIGLFDAIGESWRASDGHTVHLALAFTALTAGWAMLFAFGSAALAVVFSGSDMPTFWLLAHILPLLLMGLSVTAYRQLRDDDARLGHVFA